MAEAAANELNRLFIEIINLALPFLKNKMQSVASHISRKDTCSGEAALHRSNNLASRQILDSLNQTHIVLASIKLILQK